MPSENIHIENITVHPKVDNLSTNGVSIGSEMSGGVKNVTIRNLDLRGCESGIYIKSMEGRGGIVQDVDVRNVTMSRVLQGIRLSMNYMYRRRERNLRGGGGGVGDGDSDGDGDGAAAEDESIPHFFNISFRDVRGEALEAGFFLGLKESVIREIKLEDVFLESKLGWNCAFASGTANNVHPNIGKCLRNDNEQGGEGGGREEE